jgi:hypothetical protein
MRLLPLSTNSTSRSRQGQEADGLYLFLVVTGVRHAVPVGATIRSGARRPAKYRGGCAAGISIEGGHLLIEQTILIRPAGPAAGRLTPRKVLQDVCLERRRRDNGQCDPNPLAVKEEEPFVVRAIAPPTLPPKWFMVARGWWFPGFALVK